MIPPDNYSPQRKFRGEQDDRHGGPLHWPGINGIPVRGELPQGVPLSLEDVHRAAPFVSDFRCQTFDLRDEKQREDYRWVYDRICNGLFFEKKRIDTQPDDSGYPVVYLEWTQMYYQIPKEGVKPHGRSDFRLGG
jgi:hypothetical protein